MNKEKVKHFLGEAKKHTLFTVFLTWLLLQVVVCVIIVIPLALWNYRREIAEWPDNFLDELKSDWKKVYRKPATDK